MKALGALICELLLGESQAWQRQMNRHIKSGYDPGEKAIDQYTNLSLKKGVKFANYFDKMKTGNKITHPFSKKSATL